MGEWSLHESDKSEDKESKCAEVQRCRVWVQLNKKREKERDNERKGEREKGRKRGREEGWKRGVPLLLFTVVSHVCCPVSHAVFAEGEHCVSRPAADSAARPFPKGVAHSIDPKHTPAPDH